LAIQIQSKVAPKEKKMRKKRGASVKRVFHTFATTCALAGTKGNVKEMMKLRVGKWRQKEMLPNIFGDTVGVGICQAYNVWGRGEREGLG